TRLALESHTERSRGRRTRSGDRRASLDADQSPGSHHRAPTRRLPSRDNVRVGYEVAITDVEARPTAAIRATTTWQEFRTLWGRGVGRSGRGRDVPGVAQHHAVLGRGAERRGRRPA